MSSQNVYLIKKITTTDKYDDVKKPLFEVKDLSVSFRQYQTGLHETNVQVIKKFNLTIHHGEIVAVVGSSGSGKSLLADAILGILPENATLGGTIHFKGKELLKSNQVQLRGKEIFLIPQSISALDPLMKSGKQVQAVLKGKNKKSIQQRIFEKVGLSTDVGDRYPFELSGGMARRVLVSTAMASTAKLVIADEPTPGLDERALSETIRYIKQMADDGKGILFITHDISTALMIADKVAVFYAGLTVEIANKEDFIGDGKYLRHPYTKALWSALPENGFTPLKGTQPLANEIISGCAFSDRCPIATDICTQKQPEAKQVAGGLVRCFHA